MAADLTATRDRLIEKGLNADYKVFNMIGAVLAIIGLALFGMALMGDGSHRAWQTFHVNWVFWTGLTGGSIAITAVHGRQIRDDLRDGLGASLEVLEQRVDRR